MSVTTVGKILLKYHTPDKLKPFVTSNTMDKQGINQFFNQLAKEYPDQYKEVVTNLNRLGFETSTRQGSSVSLSDLITPIDKDKLFNELQRKVNAIRNGPGTKQAKEAKILHEFDVFTKALEKAIVTAGVKHNQTLAKVITSGSRGSPTQLRQTIASPVLFADDKGTPMTNFIIRNSFADGLTAPEYLLHSFGSRAGALGTKLCHTGDTIVRCADFSGKKIKDIKVGDWVMGADKQGNTFPVKVTNVFDNGVRPVYRYKLRVLQSRTEFVYVEATEDHKVLMQLKRGPNNPTSVYAPTPLPLSNLSKTYGRLYPSQSYSGGKHKYEHRGLWLGLLLGNGCTTQLDKSNVFLSCADPLLLSDIEEYVASLNYKLVKTQKVGVSYRFNYIERPNRRTVNGLNYSGDVNKDWLKEMGMEGTYAHEKYLPDNFHEWDNQTLAEIIGGLFSCDGSIYIPKNWKGATLELTLTAKKLVYQVKEILETRFGIYASSIKRIPKETRPNAINDLYKLIVSYGPCVLKFAEQIPLYGQKRLQIKEAVSNVVISNNNKDINYSFLEKEYLGELPTYDIEVDHPDHLYVLTNGVITSNSIADSGYASKQIARAALPVKVEEHDCGTTNGLPVSSSDKDSIGAFLARPIGGYLKNTEITSTLLANLRNKKINELIVRSPSTCRASLKHHSTAVCQLCCGVREKGTLPAIGSYIGAVTSNAIGEPLAQSTLNTKHQASSAALGKTVATGFKLIEQLLNPRKHFVDKAAIAEVDGKVTSVKKLAQGGYNIVVTPLTGKPVEHYVYAGFSPIVKVNAKVEAGDQLSEGIVDPSDIVRHKGIGEGRRNYINTLYKAFDESGIGVNRRNFEVVTKANIDHVKITDPNGYAGHLPDTIVSYQEIEKQYTPRTNSKKVAVDKALGKYLEVPELHLTIGTRLTSTMIAMLKRNGVKEVTVNDNPPPFQPEMLRLLDVPGQFPDFAHQLYSSYLEKRLINAVNTGMKSSTKGPSPVMGLSYGVGFAKQAEEEEPIYDLDWALKIAEENPYLVVDIFDDE